MNIVKTAGVIVGMVLSFLSIVVAYVFIGWGWSDSGCYWSVTQWVLKLIPWSLPFWFSFWIIYRFFHKGNETDDVQIFYWTVRPGALRRALLAELFVVVLVLLCGLVLNAVVKKRMEKSPQPSAVGKAFP